MKASRYRKCCSIRISLKNQYLFLRKILLLQQFLYQNTFISIILAHLQKCQQTLMAYKQRHDDIDICRSVTGRPAIYRDAIVSKKIIVYV